MLDDLKYIHERDSQDALGIAEKQWQQFQYAYNFSWQPPQQIDNVVVAGMGGSGLAAKIFKNWPGLSVPYEVVQSYDLPRYVSNHTLLICTSYSGNTEEILTILGQALKDDLSPEQKPMIVVIAAGGKLSDIARDKGLPFIQIPSGFQPRMTTGYQMRALVELFEQTPLLKGASEELVTATEWLKEQTQSWRPDVATKDNPAKQIAQELIGKSIVVYGGPLLSPAAYKWKISFNENGKHIAWMNQYPEFNHNEFLGWTKQPVDKPYAVIDLRSNLENPEVQKRFEISERLLSGLRPSPIVVQAQGSTLLEQLIWTVSLGDFVSLYLALLNNLNPTPVELIEKFKLALLE